MGTDSPDFLKLGNLPIISPISDSKYLTKTNENLKTETILITEDKLKIILLEHRDKLTLSGKWFSPFSIAVTLIIALISTTFHDVWIFKAEFIHAIFFLSLLISVCCTVIWGVKAFRNRKLTTIKAFIEMIKDEKK